MDFFLRQAEARVTSARVAVLMVPVVAALFAAVDVILYLFALLAGVLRPGDTPWEHLWTFQALLGTLILVGGVNFLWLLIVVGSDYVQRRGDHIACSL